VTFWHASLFLHELLTTDESAVLIDTPYLAGLAAFLVAQLRADTSANEQQELFLEMVNFLVRNTDYAETMPAIEDLYSCLQILSAVDDHSNGEFAKEILDNRISPLLKTKSR